MLEVMSCSNSSSATLPNKLDVVNIIEAEKEHIRKDPVLKKLLEEEMEEDEDE